MLAYVAKNDSEHKHGETINVLNRQSALPLIDVHCHVFGQSLTKKVEPHKWSSPTKVTFVKAGTDGKVRHLVDPTVLIFEPIPQHLKDAAQDIKKKGEALEEAGNTPLGKKAKQAGSFLAGKAKKEMPKTVDEETLKNCETAGLAAGAAAVAFTKSINGVSMDKVNARGVVEVPAKDWPPKGAAKTIGKNYFFVYELSKGGKILDPGLNGPGTFVGDLKWLISQIDNEMARFVTYFIGDDGANAKAVLNGIPRAGGRAIVPLLLDFGYTPLNVPIPLAGGLASRLATWFIDLPPARADDDGYYSAQDKYLWFDRDLFEHTYEELSRVSVRLAYQCWPFIPFDPRRPDALDHVKRGLDELGFVGVKLYSRCGWMPYENEIIHGTRGANLDERLEGLYDYLIEKDLPVLCHTSPGGFPPNAAIALPKEYSTGDMFHSRLLYPGRIGIGPLPVAAESLLKKIAKMAHEASGLPTPKELMEQAKATRSNMLEKVGTLADKAKKLSSARFKELFNAAQAAKSMGASDLSRLISLSHPSKLSDMNARQELSKYINPDHLKEISKSLNPQDYFKLAEDLKDADFREINEVIEPKDALSNAQQKLDSYSEDDAKKAGLKVLFEIVCDALARHACYEAAKFCHYVQYTVSPYAWEPVLKKYPDLRLNFAHCGGENTFLTHFGYDLVYEQVQKEEAEKKKKEKEEAKKDTKKEEKRLTGAAGQLDKAASQFDKEAEQRLKSVSPFNDDDDEKDDEKDDKPKLTREDLEKVEKLMEGLHEHPMVASGKRFKKLFPHCVKHHTLFTMLSEIGTGEEGVDPTKEMGTGLMEQVMSKLRPLIFSKVLDTFSLKEIADGVVKNIPTILKEELWQQWFEDWAEEFPDDWVTKIESLMGDYKNVHADLAYLTGETDGAFKELLGRLIHKASPETTDESGQVKKCAKNLTEGETIFAERIMLATDWFMTEMHGIGPAAYWGHIDEAINNEHPLWERWASENAINYLNLKDRIPTLEDFYEKQKVPTRKRPDWWMKLKAHYEKEDE